MRCLTLVPFLIPLTIGASQAGESHGAHVHGQAQLTLAAEAQQLEVMLVSPVVNFIGFEYQPKTDAEQDVWQKSRTLLQSGQWLQLPATAKCELKQQQLNDPWAHSGHHHADIELTLSYSCQDPAALSEVSLDLFRHAADLHDVEVQWINGSQQGAAKLTSKQRAFRLSAGE